MNKLSVHFFPNNTEDISSMIQQLYNTSNRYEIDMSDESLEILSTSIKEGKINPLWMTSDKMVSLVEKLSKDKELDEFLGSVMRMKDTMNNTDKMTPTDHFKSHCGKEWLNSEGKLSIDNILEFLYQQIQFRGIKTINNYIITDKWLQDLLQDYRPSIHKDELAVIAHQFFT